jgi:hypothetical protein
MHLFFATQRKRKNNKEEKLGVCVKFLTRVVPKTETIALFLVAGASPLSFFLEASFSSQSIIVASHYLHRQTFKRLQA